MIFGHDNFLKEINALLLHFRRNINETGIVRTDEIDHFQVAILDTFAEVRCIVVAVFFSNDIVQHLNVIL